MLRSEHAHAHREHLPLDLFRVRILALVREYHGHVVHGGQRVKMLCPKHARLRRQHLAQRLLGLPVVSLVEE